MKHLLNEFCMLSVFTSLTLPFGVYFWFSVSCLCNVSAGRHISRRLLQVPGAEPQPPSVSDELVPEENSSQPLPSGAKIINHYCQDLTYILGIQHVSVCSCIKIVNLVI